MPTKVHAQLYESILNTMKAEDIAVMFENPNNATAKAFRDVVKLALNSKKRITFTNHQNNLENSDIFILCIPTPINNKKRPALSELKKACKLVSKYLKNGNLVIIESTVEDE